MNEQKFKEFLRGLHSDCFDVIEIYTFDKIMTLDISCWAILDLTKDNNYNLEDFKQWLNEVKQERGLE